MTGGGGGDGCGGGIAVPDFAHQHHIGVMTQKIADGVGKIIARLGINLGLPNQGDVILNGIFHRDDILLH